MSIPGNIDLTENRDFGEKVRVGDRLIEIPQFSNIDELNSESVMLRVFKKIRYDDRYYSVLENPWNKICACCGRLLAPWKNVDLCERCENKIYPTGIPWKKEEMKSELDIFHKK